MAMQSEGKDAKGRNYDQVTKDGGGSAGSLGAGGTGDVGSLGAGGSGDIGSPGAGGQPGNAQRAARTDDLLSAGADGDQQGYAPAEEAGELQTGLGGIGSLSTGNAGNRQSEGEDQPGQHKDWGHSPVETGRKLPRQGVMPGEEMGHLQGGRDDSKNRR